MWVPITSEDLSQLTFFLQSQPDRVTEIRQAYPHDITYKGTHKQMIGIPLESRTVSVLVIVVNQLSSLPSRITVKLHPLAEK